MRPGDHHTRQFRRRCQLIKEFGGGSELPKDEDRESIVIKRETSGSRAASPSLSNRGTCNVAQEMGDAQRAQVTAKANNQSNSQWMNQGLAPNMRKHPACWYWVFVHSCCVVWCICSDYLSCFLSRLIRWFVAFVLHCFPLFALFV